MKARVLRIVVAVGVVVLAMAAVGIWLWPRAVEHSIDYKMPGNPGPKIAAAEAAAIERRERVVAQTVWRKELEAQEYGRVFEDFWDALNAETNAASKWEVVEGFRFGEVALGQRRVKESLPLGIEGWVAAKGEKLESPRADSYESYEGWVEKVRGWKAAGWGIMQCEFRHNAFDPQTNDVPAKSRFYFSAHLTNAASARAMVEGDIEVEWRLGRPPTPKRVDASNLGIKYRPKGAGFELIHDEELAPPSLNYWIEPLIVYDLDKDGSLEIALPGLNRVYRRADDGYSVEKLCALDRIQVMGGVFGDFDSDGITDFLYTEHRGLFLMRGEGAPRFKTPIAAAELELLGARSVTCGDVDVDGDLDVFVGQYKGPFVGGNMPTPYYDANDGYPSYLLINDGSGKFVDATAGSGLESRRFRRVYAASFVDMDRDGSLDLAVTSDFAGVDIFRNNGKGKFANVTLNLLDDPHVFGMSHVFGDFNGDGLMDFFVGGMTSPTASRLDHLRLVRPRSGVDEAMRARMNIGSRLYLAKEAGKLESEPGAAGQRLAGSAARTGWTWGAAAADFDNDGWTDLYVGNGMESGNTVRDYDAEFWLHDIFVGDSREGNTAAQTYFFAKGDRTRGRGMSYGGYDKNRLLLNRGGEALEEVAHLLGIALEEDCRNVVAADLDRDGDQDIVVTSVRAVAGAPQRLRIFRNGLNSQGNWIGFGLREQRGQHAAGATVSIRQGEKTRSGVIVTGDAFRSQSPAEIHFGLGEGRNVDWAEIKWPGGASLRIAGPEINRLHWVKAPIEKIDQGSKVR